MKKGAPVFLVIILTAFPGMVKAEGLEEWIGFLSFSETFENSNQTDTYLDPFVGVGLNVPLVFSGKAHDNSLLLNTTHLMIEPGVSVEYSFLFSNMLRIRTGAHLGKFDVGLLSLGWYIGLSGAFIQDFANDAAAFGISPEIGVECYLFYIGCRLQAQYDFYTDERYNRFVFTLSVSVGIFGSIYGGI